ncbi:phosphodiester glycosidase family protein [Candidatus Daviesbacteria bacterium]|nr:phosphodiester glycosidase family protein [Candidatus Daviesbacteria bacterium]
MFNFPGLRNYLKIFSPITIILLITTFVFGIFYYSNNQYLTSKINTLKAENSLTSKKLASVSGELTALKSEDQLVRNNKLQEEIKNIQTTYGLAVSTYEKLLDVKTVSKDTTEIDEIYARSLKLLSERNFASSAALLSQISKQIQGEKEKVSASFNIAANVPVNNAVPLSGFRRQQVQVDGSNFLVDIVSADLGSTRVIVDTASDSDCSSNCPVLSLGDYVSRNGAFAGINGSYFCPSTYPSCAGKENTFDLLVMNKNKHYFNSDNNVYSNNPAVIFGSGWIRFVGKAQEWGRDTAVDGVLSNFPLLVSGSSVVYSDNPDPKFNSKGPRGFVANKGSTVYIGFVYNATMGESARALKVLGVENAMNLDEGGSTALWSGGYKAGPGRNIPNAILFVRK